MWMLECVVKVDPTTKPAPASTTVTITAKAAGETTVELGNGAISYNVTGTDSSHFSPMLSCNRATVVTFLYRAYN